MRRYALILTISLFLCIFIIFIQNKLLFLQFENITSFNAIFNNSLVWKDNVDTLHSTNSFLQTNATSIENVTAHHEEVKNDVTLTSQTSPDRFFYFPYLTKRWTGPIYLVIGLEKNETLKMDQHKAILDAYPHIDYQFFETSETYYPINKLRNIAIKSIKTTHFYVCDMDFWPSSGLYKRVLELPDYILNDDWLAIIVPGFQYENKIEQCSPFQECVEKVLPSIPSTKQELRKCMVEKKCDIFSPGGLFHRYHYSTWFEEPYHRKITMLNNLVREQSEPYLIVRKSEHMPLFDERFINYGYNKQQWVENLRYVGYKFAQLVQGYGIDIPHPIVKFKKSWYSDFYTKNGLKNQPLYKKFLSELHRSVEKSVVTGDSRLVNRNPFQNLK